MNIINQIMELVKQSFINSRVSHGWDHTQRVYNLCLQIGEKEQADLEVLKLAAIMHDIGREYETASNGTICHAEKGAMLAKDILQDFSFDDAKLTAIIHCIETHRFRGHKRPQSLEAKILFDADKLDSIGAVGIGRAFLFSGEIGAKLHNNQKSDMVDTQAYSIEDTAYREYLVKLQHVKDKIQTEEGKRLAAERHEFMVRFFGRFNQEIAGEL